MDPEQAARMLVAATDGLQVQWLLAPQSLDMPATLRRYLAFVVAVDL